MIANRSLTLLKARTIHSRPGASLTGVIGMLALISSVAFLYLGMQEQRAIDRRAGSTLAPLSARVSAPQGLTAPIETIQVGRRVVAGNPQMTPGQVEQIEQVISARWRKITLEMTKSDGGRLDIVLLRPMSWLLDRDARPGDEVRLNIPEMGAEGVAKVISIDPCPPIAPGGGRVVTGTFAHSAGNVIDLTIEGVSSPIGTTANHPFWSEDRLEFVPAGSLRPGELLRGLQGSARVVSIVPRAGPEAVYNIEVHGEHVYHVASGGVLVHNAYGSGKGGRLGNRKTRQHVSDVADELEARGWEVTGGGGRLPEEYLPGPGGGRKGSNWLDITAAKKGKTVRVNTVDTLVDGVTPSAREAAAAAKIRAKTPGEHLVLIPKPRK